MGLCKCPKRKVTNQFCFEHRVNVCEHCMVSNHPKVRHYIKPFSILTYESLYNINISLFCIYSTQCIVQSYCQWLKDSDYNSICILCSSELAGGECVRLVCYRMFYSLITKLLSNSL